MELPEVATANRDPVPVVGVLQALRRHATLTGPSSAFPRMLVPAGGAYGAPTHGPPAGFARDKAA